MDKKKKEEDLEDKKNTPVEIGVIKEPAVKIAETKTTERDDPEPQNMLTLPTIPTLSAVPPEEALRSSGVARRVDGSLVETILSPRFRDKVVTAWSYTISERVKTILFEYGLKIGDFSDKFEFEMAKEEMYLKLIEFYGGLNHGFDTYLYGDTKRVRLPTEMGLDILGLRGRVLEGHDAIISDAFSALGVIGDFSPSASGTYVCISASEQRLNQLLSGRWTIGNKVTLDEMRNWFSALSNSLYQLAPLPDDFDYNNYVWEVPNFRPRFAVFNDLVLRNAALREWVLKINEAIVTQHLGIPSTSESKMFSELLTTFSIRVGQYARVNALPSQISRDKAVEFVRTLTLTLLNSRIMRMSYSPDMESFHLETLIDCIMIKLFVPARCLTDRTILDVDNYLAIHMFRMLRCFRAERRVFDSAKVKNATANYALEFLSNGDLWVDGAPPKGLLNFMASVEHLGYDENHYISNFSECGVLSPAYGHVHDLNDDYLGRDVMYYNYFGGGAAMQLPVNDDQQGLERMQLSPDVEVLRVTQFKAFAEEACDAQFWDGSHKEDRYAMSSLFAKLLEYSHTLCSVFYEINMVQRRCGAVCTMFPGGVQDLTASYVEKPIPSMAVLSSVLLMSWDQIVLPEPDVSTVAFGWQVPSAVYKFKYLIQMVNDTMDSVIYPRGTRYKRAVELLAKFADNNTERDFATFIGDKFMGTALIQRLDIGERRDFIADAYYLALERAYAKNFFDEMPPYTMGYTTGIWYTRNPHYMRNVVSKIEYYTPRSDVDGDNNEQIITIDAETLNHLITSDWLTERIDQGLAESTRIKFDMNAPLRIYRMAEIDPVIEDALDVTVSGYAAKIKPVYFSYRFSDILRNEKSNKYAFAKTPHFYPNTTPNMHRTVANIIHDFLREDVYLKKFMQGFPTIAFKFNLRLF